MKINQRKVLQMTNLNLNFKKIYNKSRKLINRIFLFILAMPMGIPLLLPFFLIYVIYLSISLDGRNKLRNYYLVFMYSMKLIKTKDGRKELWLNIKKFWDGKTD